MGLTGSQEALFLTQLNLFSDDPPPNKRKRDCSGGPRGPPDHFVKNELSFNLFRVSLFVHIPIFCYYRLLSPTGPTWAQYVLLASSGTNVGFVV